MVKLWARTLAVLLLAGLAGSARADEVLVLKGGRKIPVTRLARRDGQVVFIHRWRLVSAKRSTDR